LKEALRSPFFSAIRERQPFSYNTLRPCPIIDHPQVMWNIIEEHGAKATHPGAEDTFTTFMPEINAYAAKVADIMDDCGRTKITTNGVPNGPPSARCRRKSSKSGARSIRRRGFAPAA
jgi:hypothetical protein